MILSVVDVCEIIYLEQENIKTLLFQSSSERARALFSFPTACREMQSVIMRGIFMKRFKRSCCHHRITASLVLEMNIWR